MLATPGGSRRLPMQPPAALPVHRTKAPIVPNVDRNSRACHHGSLFPLHHALLLAVFRAGHLRSLNLFYAFMFSVLTAHAFHRRAERPSEEARRTWTPEGLILIP